MLDSIRDYFKDQVFQTVIGTSIRLVESVMHGMPALVYDPGSVGARDYRYLCWELLEKEAAKMQES
jgi:cellulose biosynthesis protein BcsQ